MKAQNKNQVYKDAYKSFVQASYFNHMGENKFTKTSKIQIEKIEEAEEIDENTFRLMTGFKMPENDFSVYRKVGRFFIEEEGFFSCMGSRKKYQVQLNNYQFKVTYGEGGLFQYIDFSVVCATINGRGDHFILEIEKCKNKFYFEPVEHKQKQEKVREVDEWVSFINKIINLSEGKKNRFSYLPETVAEFYKNYHISNEQFQRCANSGDIILFKSQHSAATVQRVFTNSEYDHVGIVLRNKKNEIYIYESTSSDGVGLTPWRHMVKFQWYKSTDKIAWRRLTYQMTPNDIATIEEFITQKTGKKFNLTLSKLFTGKSNLKRTEQEENQKTYFCSELVARLYKELHLIDQEKSSTRYFPVDFSEKGKLDFIKSCRLEPERIIAFNKVA